MNEELYDALLRVASKRVGRALAADVVHDAVLRALEHYGPLVMDNEPLLVRCVIRRAIDVQRGKAPNLSAPRERSLVYETRSPNADVAETACRNVWCESIIATLYDLKSPEYPVPLLLCLALGWTVGELAMQFHKTTNAIKLALFRERQALRAQHVV